jgi:hypothetical protein
MNAESLTQRIFSAVEVGAVIGAFGYMTLRAHWNYLGVTSIAGIGLERYLMEVYGIVAGQLPFVLLIALLIAAVFFPLRALLVKAIRRRPSLDDRFSRMQQLVRRTSPSIVLILLAVAQIRLLQVASGGRCRMDVALNDLKARAADGCYEPEPRVLLFYGLVLLCIAGVLIGRRESFGRLHKIVLMAAVLLALQLPILYGTHVKTPLYPGAKVVTTSLTRPVVIGLLVLQTEELVEVWTVRNGRGEMVVVPRESIASMTVTDIRDLLAVARAAAADPRSFAASCGVIE